MRHRNYDRYERILIYSLVAAQVPYKDLCDILLKYQNQMGLSLRIFPEASFKIVEKKYRNMTQDEFKEEMERPSSFLN